VVPTQDDALPLQEERKAIVPAIDIDLAEAMRQENPVLAPDRLPPSAPEPFLQPPSVPAPSTVQVVGLIQPTKLALDDLDDDDDEL
jgi:hypothetical protein